MAHLWLRCEHKETERRSPIVPEHAKILTSLGHVVTVEESEMRAYSAHAYEAAGCNIVKPYTWKNAPLDAYILGLKELDDSDSPVSHKHIYFSHSFQGQRNAKKILSRFKIGDGMIYDLEYFRDVNNKRIASFGYHAGISAAALGINAYHVHVTKNKPILDQPYYKSSDELLNQIIADTGIYKQLPEIMILGSEGNCARGVKSALDQLKIKYVSFGKNDIADIENTRRQLLESDIIFNCVSIDGNTQPFIQQADLAKTRKLSIIVDLACDIGKPNNPLPIYNKNTSLQSPVMNITSEEQPLWVISIDNLASILPIESSQYFSHRMLPYYAGILNGTKNICITNAMLAFENEISKLK